MKPAGALRANKLTGQWGKPVVVIQVAGIFLACGLLTPAWPAQAEEIRQREQVTSDRPPNPKSTAYRVGVQIIVNGELSDEVMLASIDNASGTISLRAGDLRKLRVMLQQDLEDDFQVDLHSVRGLKFLYDEPRQELRLDIDASARKAYTVKVSGIEPPDLSQLSLPTGAVVNYQLYGGSASGSGSGAFLNGSFEGRIFSAAGTLSLSGTASTEELAGRRGKFVRLDSTWRTIDPEKVRSYAVGDFVTSSLSWTGSYRMAGLQIQSAFAMRPDIVTVATPEFAGTAALPSTLELYVSNSKIFTGQIPAGPFSLQQFPQLSGGDVKIVTKDLNGNETIIKGSFYYAPNLLKKRDFGLFWGSRISAIWFWS